MVSPTIRLPRLEDKLGLAGSATCDLNFDGTQAQLLGEADKGFSLYADADEWSTNRHRISGRGYT